MMRGAGLDDTGHDNNPGSETTGGTGQDEAGFDAADPRRDGTPGARKLAQDWITLWQSELSAIASDPEIRESWQTIIGLWAGSMSTMLRGLPRDPAAYRHDNTRRPPGTPDAPGSATSAAAPDARDAEIERLSRHVAALERRLAELERAGDPPIHPKGRPGRKPRQ